MMSAVKDALVCMTGLASSFGTDLVDLFYPRPCPGCGNPLPSPDQPVCQFCLVHLPGTNFERHPDNPVEKLFLGRIPLLAATASYYFTRESPLQHMIHHLKYLNNPELGVFLGSRMGYLIRDSGRFDNMEAVVPLPLYAKRQQERGYNQSECLARGMSAVLGIPMIRDGVLRIHRTASQTRKTRQERWQNVTGSFKVCPEKILPFSNILLVDDVVTTGATLEACATALLGIPGLKLGIATLAHADR